MGKVKGKHRLDKYYHLAKEHGYRSRAAWKLVQMDSKFSFLRSSRGILDLCAAPGGWMQVAVERAPVASLVVGIDLVPIRPVRGAVAIEEDITKTECKSKIKRVMNEHGCRAFDLVLHDGSPNVGGAWAQEATSQNSLVIDSVRLATEFLAPKGTFLTKVFRSQDYSAVLYCLKQLFEKVEVEKPAASRSASAEIYIIGFKFKAPAKIDPRLLDYKHLFQSGGIEKRKVVDVLGVSKQKRHRDGYEDGETVLRRVCTAADFIWSATPVDILGSVNSITFDDPASLPIKENALTTAEVKALCDDLQVLGKKDFRDLLRWRTVIRKALAPKTSPSTVDVEPANMETEEEKILNEMEELTNAMDQKNKRAKKLIAKRKSKDKARKAMGTQIDATEDGYADHELFSLSSMKDKKELVAVDAAESDDEAADVADSDDESTKDPEDSSGSDVDSDEERRRYDEKLEGMLDQFYKQYVERKEGSSKQRKRIKKMAENGELFEDGDNETTIQSDQDSDNDGGVHEANPLMVQLGEEPTQEEIASKWFSQDVFEDDEEPASVHAADKSDTEDEMEVDEEEEDNQLPLPKEKTKKEPPSVPSKTKKTRAQEAKAAAKAEDDFEIVPAPATDSSDDDSSADDESDDDNVNTKAEILAYAKKMLRKKDREHMIDDAYNKYMFHDDKGLPKWFVEEESKHNVPIKPITKEEVAAMRAQFKAIDARPAKKVAQAKARKKRVAMRQLEKVRKKANTISDQADISDRSKTKMIDQLYKKATPKRPAKEYVVAKKGVQVKTGKGKVLVDRRMKKDARALKKKGKGGSNKGGKGAKAPKGKGAGKGSSAGGNKGGYKGRKTKG